MAKLGIRKALEEAKSGKTKKEIMEQYGMSKEEYRTWLAQYSPKNRSILGNLLRGNAKRKRPENTDSELPEVPEVKLLDTSFIVSNFFRYDGEEGYVGTLLPQVYEQLAVIENKGNKKLCKMFHLMLDGMLDIRFVKESYVPKNISKGEDPADMEILEYAKVTSGAVVYTCNKSLALWCKQQEIDYKYFDKSRQKTNLPITKNDGRTQAQIRAGVVVYTACLKVKRAVKGVVEIKGGEYLLFNHKFYKFDNEGNYEEVSKVK